VERERPKTCASAFFLCLIFVLLWFCDGHSVNRAKWWQGHCWRRQRTHIHVKARRAPSLAPDAPATTWLLYLSGIRIFLSALICIFLIQRTSELRCRTAISAVNDHGLGYAWGRVRKFYLGTLYLDIQGEPQPPKYTQNVIFGVMKIVDPALSVAVVLSGLKGLFAPLSFVITGTNGI
jgi:hypothetical protein